MASRGARYVLTGVIVVVVIAAFLVYRSQQRSIRLISVATAERQNIHTGVVTNGKAEPVSFREVRSEIEGTVAEIFVREGDRVSSGQNLMRLGEQQVASELEHARAELADAEEAARLLRQGGNAAQVADLQAQLAEARRQRDIAAKTVQQNERLLERGAIARAELEASRNALAKAEADAALLEKKLQPDPAELARADARVEAARAALAVAQSHQRSTLIKSPLMGIAYSIAVRVGDHLAPGDVVARVGDISRILVRVYVDEPDLGRVSANQRVLVRWEGLPGREWTGTVERLPSEVQPLGSRNVGEVLVTVDNSERLLLPNMNLNVEIITEQKDHALTVPREAVAGAEGNRYVFLVRDNVLIKQPVQTGILSATRAEITRGLQEGDVVALSGETALQEGQRVRTQ